MSDSFKIGGIDNLSFDIDANGDYLYLAVLNESDQPEVLQFSTGLDEDATVQYSPGAGTEINLVCGKLNTRKVWAVGDFGSDYVIQFDGYEGPIYWYGDPQSQTWTGPVKPIHLGPDDDNLVLVTTPADDIMWESYWIAESGPYWLPVSDPLPFDVNVIDRLDLNPIEIMIGINYWYSTSETVEYSVNNGDQFVDISGDLSTLGEKITSIIYG